MTVAELFGILGPIFFILSAAGGLWKIIHDGNISRTAQIEKAFATIKEDIDRARKDLDNDIRATEIRLEEAQKSMQTAISAVKAAADLQVQVLLDRLHGFQLESAKSFCSVSTIAQVEERVGKQITQLGDEVHAMRKRVDQMLAALIEPVAGRRKAGED